MSLALIARSGLVALGLALLMPLTTLAATSPYQATIIKQVCVYSGGAHNRGYIELEAKGREVGRSGTNYIFVKSKLQESSGLAYGTQFYFPVDQSRIFPDDATNYYHVTDRRWDFPRNFEVGARIVMTFQFWSNSAGLLATRTVKGDGC